jgi:hypothetical protein
MTIEFPRIGEIELLSALHDSSSSNATAEDQNEKLQLVQVVFISAAVIATYHFCLLSVLKAVYSPVYNRNDKTNFKKVAYQLTNLSVNFALGVWGIYQYYWNVPSMKSVGIVERVNGFPQFAIFGGLQVGYNLWALPIGLLIGEGAPMICHHLAVLCVGSISCFAANGFRYHAPFFFGVVEISSVPLSIWNISKENPEMAKRRIPRLSAAARPIFALSFLLVRVLMWSPQMYDVLRISGLLGWTCEENVCRAALACFWSTATFLTMLQFYWGQLILKRIIDLLIGKGGQVRESLKKTD